MNHIPVIDLAEALQPGGLRSTEVAAQMRAAAMASGFFYMRNHGVPTDQLTRMFALAKELLDVPEATRRALALHHSPTMRGYEITGAQRLDASAHPDVKESFQCGAAYPDEHPYVKAGYHTYGHNQWPAELPHAPALCEAYIRTVEALAMRLMQLLALSLALPESYFDASFTHPMLTLRMIRYPAHPANADEHTFGAGAHTDWGALTLLAQDAHGGLEVCMPDGSWVPATPLAGTFVVNLGDMIPLWTNGRYHSTPHRVRNLYSGGAPRFSIPFFFEPDFLARIEAVPGAVPAGESPRFAPCTAGEHLLSMYHKTLGMPKAAA